MQKLLLSILFYCVFFTAAPISAQSIFPELPELQRNNKNDIDRTEPTPEIESSDLLRLPSGLNQDEFGDQPVTIAEITFEGNTLITDDEIQAVLAPFYGATILASELDKIKIAVDELYSERGYFSSGAIFTGDSDQIFDKSNTTIQLQIVERKLAKIELFGDKSARSLVQYKISKFIDKPLNEKRLFNELRFVSEEPVVDSIDIAFRKTEYINEVAIQITVEGGRLATLEGGLNNQRSPSSGRDERSLNFRHYSLRGVGDGLNINYKNTEGSNSASILYDFPINRDGGTIGIGYLYSDSKVLDEPFESTTNQFNLSFRQPILKKSTNRKQDELAVGFSVKRLDSVEKRNEVTSPLSIGSNINGKYRSTVITLFQDFSHRTTQNSLFTQSSIDIGTPIGSANDTFFGDGSFIKFGLQSQYLRRLTKRISSLTSFRGQIASRSLPNFEQFSIGGSNSIRGFDPQILDGDSGFNLNQEIQVTLVNEQGHDLKIVSFADFGLVSNKITIIDQNQSLGSVGVALRYQFLDRLIANLEYGHPVIGDRQFGSGVTFSIVGRFL